jgi:pimeloyl-ACP methyl ester carboxylesterase
MLAYVDRGQGEPVVFIHGTSQDVRTWHDQLDPVAREYRAIAYSRRYARPNTDIPPAQDDPMQPHVADLIELLGTLNAAPAHLVGNSWGGFIALLVAVQAPELVRSLILCEPPVIPLFVSNEPRPSEILGLVARKPVDAFRIARFGLGVVEPAKKAHLAGDAEKADRIFGTALLGKKHFATLPPERRQMLDENRRAEVAQLLGAGFPPLRAEDVRNVRAPVLLVNGDSSGSLFRSTIPATLHRLLPNSRRAVIADASHIMHEDNPAAFNDALVRFLRTDASGQREGAAASGNEVRP